MRERFPVLTDELVGRFLSALETKAILIPEVPRVFMYRRDPKDEPYLNLSIRSKADYLVSWDTDILDLAKPSDPDGERLRSYAPQLRILDPVTFLAETHRRQSGIG